jgi:hypothetical protein
MDMPIGAPLNRAQALDPDAVFNPQALALYGGVAAAPCVLVLLAAGRGRLRLILRSLV